jgi:pyruvate carboxylase subunit A
MEYVILGVKTTLPLHYAIMNNPEFITGKTHTHFLEDPDIKKHLPRYMRESEARMHQLADSLGKGKEKTIAVTTAVNAYMAAIVAKQGKRSQ